MRTEKFPLRSGNMLIVTVAPWEHAVALKEAVDQVLLTLDQTWDESDPRVNFKIVSTPAVRHAVLICGDKAMYEGQRVNEALFDDPKLGQKARSDWHEMAAMIIKVNREDFFLNRSLLNTSPTDPSKNQA